MGPASPKGVGPKVVPKDRLDSWKAIATYLERDVRTVQRWERQSSLPVHRLPGGPKAGVFAYRAELDEWLETSAASTVPDIPRRSRKVVWITGAIVVLLAAAAGASLLATNPAILLLSESRFTPFANSLTVQVCPSWSPDGKAIAFVANRDGKARLMVQRVDHPTALPVTPLSVSLLGAADPVWCRQAQWSSDSQWLYFVGTTDGRFGVHRISAGGGGQPLLVQQRAQAFALSPDGRSIVTFGLGDDKTFRIWAATPPDAPRKPYQPAPFESPTFSDIPHVAFSPDGTEVFVNVTIEREGRFWLLSWPPGKARRVFANAERAVGTPHAVWMPDSKHLVFSARGAIALANVRTERYWPVAMQERPMHNPSPSPEGSRIAYQSMLSHSDVIAMPLDGGPEEPLVSTTAWEQMPATSPVDSGLVFVTPRKGAPEIREKNGRVIVSARDIRVDGRQPQLLMTPVYSRDGKKIAFAAISPSRAEIFTIALENGIPVRAFAATSNEVTPSWSPDANWLAIRTRAGGRNRLMKVRVGSSDPPVDLAASCGSTTPEWSPTGEWIAFPDENCQVALVHPDGTGFSRVGGYAGVAWAPDGRTLYRVDPQKHAILALDLPSRKERIVRQVGDLLPYSGPQPGIRVSTTADGRKLVYSVLRPREEIWILEDVRIREPWSSWVLSLWRR